MPLASPAPHRLEMKPPGIVDVQCSGQRFQPGDLLWARSADCPYWPCIVCQPDGDESLAVCRPAESCSSITDQQLEPLQQQQLAYHVRYFGSVPETDWVPDDGCNLMHYSDKTPESFQIPARLRPAWEAACAGAAAAAAGSPADAPDDNLDSVFDLVISGGAGGDKFARVDDLEFHRLAPPPCGVTKPAPPVCDVCEAALTDTVHHCRARCGRVGHAGCLGIDGGDDGLCSECRAGRPPRCFLCDGAAAMDSAGVEGGGGVGDAGVLAKCRVRGCGRVYHAACVAACGGGGAGACGGAFRRSGRGAGDNGDAGTGGGLVCPQHECLTCRLLPVDQAIRFGHRRRFRMLRCIRCPAAYHAGQRCLPAGSRRVDSGHIVCPAHEEAAAAHQPPASVTRCLTCRRPGWPQRPLIRCPGCPAAHHADCRGGGGGCDLVGVGECPDCRRLGRHRPLYGDVVWARPHLRRAWWPGEVLHDPPGGAAASAAAYGDFAVRLFGDCPFAVAGSGGDGCLDGQSAVVRLTRARVIDFDLAESCLADVGEGPEGDGGDGDSGGGGGLDPDGERTRRRRAIRLAVAARDRLRAARQAASLAAERVRPRRRPLPTEGDVAAASPASSTRSSSISSSTSSSSSDGEDGFVDDKPAIEDVAAADGRPRRRRRRRRGQRPPPFKPIKVNYPIGNARIVKCDLSEVSRCDCPADSAEPCGSDAACLNRALSYECHPAVCPSGERCLNRRFVTRRYPAQEAFRTPDGRGWGLRACVDIAKGDFVTEYVGDLIDPDEAERRLVAADAAGCREFYMLTLDKWRVIDAGPRGNLSRFLNHSCAPNLQARKWSVAGDLRIGLFALREIRSGEELTFNYRFQWYGEGSGGSGRIPCLCGAANCAGFLGGSNGSGSAQAEARQQQQQPDEEPQSCAQPQQQQPFKRPRGRPRLTPMRGRGCRGRGRGRGRGGLCRGGGGSGGGGGVSRRVIHEDECFRCGDGGRLVLCSKEGCPKAYHADCLGLAKPPFGRWICPWHHCDDCGQPASLRCSACPVSYCDSHCEGRFEVASCDDAGDLVCTEHRAVMKNAEADAAVVAEMETKL